eukprot:205565-Chlamydomonas_euryale.AAC.1
MHLLHGPRSTARDKLWQQRAAARQATAPGNRARKLTFGAMSYCSKLQQARWRRGGLPRAKRGGRGDAGGRMGQPSR